jgi:sortase family protein
MARKYEAHSTNGVPTATARWARVRFGHRNERTISQSAASPPARAATTISPRANSSTAATRTATTPTVVTAPVTTTRTAATTRRGVVRRSPPPVRIEIPAIGVSSALVRLGLNPDGTMQVPVDYARAGWFTGGPAPGDTGPAVIAGHVDSRSGPAVFYRLRELRGGDAINIVRADGSTARFVTDEVVRYPKRAFPTQAVFGPVPDPALRLITCGGRFDRARRSYDDNVIVTAHLGGP